MPGVGCHKGSHCHYCETALLDGGKCRRRTAYVIFRFGRRRAPEMPQRHPSLGITRRLTNFFRNDPDEGPGKHGVPQMNHQFVESFSHNFPARAASSALERAGQVPPLWRHAKSAETGTSHVLALLGYGCKPISPLSP